ncbi:MAG: hypothetical protein FJY88_14105, partial [Candidatus Eisenbacteria bacterium]|nr:hypothetical protein [Candidatus Eisenbacteria bacterium]
MIRSAANMRAGGALLIIALCCAAPPCSRAEDLLVLPGLPGRASIGADTLDTRSLIAGIRWSGLDLRDLGGKLEGACIGMEAAVLRGRYDVRCDLSAAGDSACSSDLFICDEIAISGIRLSAGTIQSVSSTAVVERGPLTLLLKPDVGCRVRLSRVSISPADASGGVSLGSLSPAAADGLPRNRPLARSSRTCLREACEHLVRHQVSTGLFDYRTAAWRDASYSVRALLAGYEILGDRTYLEAARRTILAFLSEQRPDGGWCPFCRAQ